MNSEQGAGNLTESLQLQAVALTVKALIATHPNPEELGIAMRDLFSQFQSTPVFHTLTEAQRLWVRDMFRELLPKLPDTTE